MYGSSCYLTILCFHHLLTVSHFTSSDHKPVRGLFFLPSRPSFKIDNLTSPLFNIELSHITCKDLKPEESLIGNDIDSFIRVRCEPADLVKTSVRNKFQTSTMKNTDRPSWRKDVLKFTANIVSKELVLGSSIFFESVQENLVIGNSVVGTCVLDLEQLIRTNMGTENGDGSGTPLSFELLRHGKVVGKLTCELNVSWGSAPRTNRSSSDKQSSNTKKQSTHRSNSTGSEGNKKSTHRSNSTGSDKEKKSSSHRSKSVEDEAKLHKKSSHGSDNGHRSKSSNDAERGSSGHK